MASRKIHVMRCAISLLIIALFAVACSSNDPAEPAAATPEPSPQDQASGADDSVSTESPGPSAVPEPTLSDEDVASVTSLEAGSQVEDAQGNLIVIYGVAEWPQTFDALSDTSQADFPFFGDVEDAADPTSELVVLDVGMCAAGINARGFGTAEFFVQESPTDALSTDPVLGRGVLALHPVVRPGFGFPAPAECTRGWLPVLWGGQQAPEVARYVLATRESASAEVERHVYQWELDVLSSDTNTETDSSDTELAGELFTAGQTVTFNEGLLDDTTIVVDGWSELVGAASPIDGTRLVAVSLDFCPASQRMPQFGLGADGWNVIAPVDGDLFGATGAEDPTTSCFAGRLEFAVPFGAVPTAFFASDGANAVDGYAEWSLVNAAIPAPQ